MPASGRTNANNKLPKISITVPPLANLEEARQAMVYGLDQMQNHLVGNLPITEFAGSRLSNVSVPIYPDDVVTLRYLNQIIPSTTNTTSAPGGTGGPFIRTLELGNLNVGALIAPAVPIMTPGQGIEWEAVLRKAISTNLVVTIYRNAEVSPLFTVTVPSTLGTLTALTSSITGVNFKYLDVLWADITASDGSTDPNGIVTVTIVWK